MKKKLDVKPVYYTFNDVIDVLDVTNNFLVIGCPKCRSNPGSYGTFKLYNPETLELLFEVRGTDNNRNLAKAISYNYNTDYSEQIWYTSTDGGQNVQFFNTILATQKQDLSGWDFWNK